MSALTIVAAASDVGGWIALRDALWPGEDHTPELRAMAATGATDRLALLARDGAAAVGLVEAAMRHDYVNGCDSLPVAFVEGLYVVPDRRGHGIARRLVDHVADWARAGGCTELASDTALDNDAAQRTHEALGFVETERVVFFRRALSS